VDRLDIDAIRRAEYLQTEPYLTSPTQNVGVACRTRKDIDPIEKNISLIEMLDELRKSGAVTRDEFQVLKEKILKG
jgi:hypothetical protein